MLEICTNLYVPDVAAEAEFFTAIGFIELSRETFDQSLTVILAADEASTAQLQLWDIDFIRQISPEVADNKPSILFRVDDIAAWHDKVAAQGNFTSPIQEMGNKKTFNFQSPSGIYFAFLEK